MQTDTASLQGQTILQLLPALNTGGVERGTLEVAQAIVAAGGRALVASEGGRLVPHLQKLGAVHHTLPLSSKNPFRIVLNAWRIARIVRQEKVNIIHARSRAPAWSGWIASRLTQCHFVTTFHGVYGGAAHRFKQRYNAVMTKGERVIAVSQFVAQHIAAHYPEADGKVVTIPRGVDLNLFNPARVTPEQLKKLATEWRLPEDKPVILFPGRLTEWKGQDLFLKALASLPHRQFFAVLLGDDGTHPHYRARLEHLVEQGDLAGHVRIAPPTSQMCEAYMLAHVVVAVSQQPEAFGRVVVEAMACGKPVIATNHGGAAETMLPGQTGWLVPAGDVGALGEALTKALIQPEVLRVTMQRACTARAQQFTAAAMCAATLGVYQSLR